MSGPLGPTNTPHTVFLLALQQTLAPVGMFGITRSTNEERDAEGQITLFLAIRKAEWEQTQPFHLSHLLYTARLPSQQTSRGLLAQTLWFPTLREALYEAMLMQSHWRIWPNISLIITEITASFWVGKKEEREKLGLTLWVLCTFQSYIYVCMCTQQMNSSSPSYHHLWGREHWDRCPYA